jgi:hypothetical protein
MLKGPFFKIYFTYFLGVIFALFFNDTKASSDSLVNNLSGFDRMILFSANHYSKKLNNVHSALTTGVAELSHPIRLFYESAYLNVELTNKIIQFGYSQKAFYEFLGIQFMYMDSTQLSNLYSLVKSKNILFRGIDCTGANLKAIDVLFDSTFKYYSDNKIDSKFLKAAETFVREIPTNHVYMVMMLLPKNDLDNLDSLYNQMLSKVNSEFLIQSWGSIVQFFEWLKLRRHDVAINSGDCKTDLEIEEYRDWIMHRNYSVFGIGLEKEIIWMGCSHSQRRVFDNNKRGDKFVLFPNSFADYLNQQRDSINTVSVLITEENLNLRNAQCFTDTIGGQEVKVFYLRKNKNKSGYYFNMKVFCGLSYKTNWFKSFDYIITVR